MASLRKGAFRLFRLAGIDVFLHWSWFLVAAIEISERTTAYSSIYWNILEYLALFLIVGIHEFGHALACRQVGGIAHQIILWPLGGVAYVSPPPRAGATLWSIAAGPLVNVLFLPLLTAPLLFNRYTHWLAAMPDLHAFLRAIWIINLGLLVFNMLPIYPLDGGQILRSLLWFVIGRARSLLVATILGFAGVIGLFALALWWQSVWFGVLAVFILLNCWNGLNHARALLRLAKAPRRVGFACPSCKSSPPIGQYWICGKCRAPFDTFESQAVCPACSTQFAVTACLDCGNRFPMSQWASTAPQPVHAS